MRALLLMILWTLAISPLIAQESGRIKRKPPTPAEAARQAAELAMNDGLLRKGDIVVTDRGFVVFQGVAADGLTNEFAPVANPIRSPK